MAFFNFTRPLLLYWYLSFYHRFPHTNPPFSSSARKHCYTVFHSALTNLKGTDPTLLNARCLARLHPPGKASLPWGSWSSTLAACNWSRLQSTLTPNMLLGNGHYKCGRDWGMTRGLNSPLQMANEWIVMCKCLYFTPPEEEDCNVHALVESGSLTRSGV